MSRSTASAGTSIGYMKDFLFGPEQARTPIEKLSGGERGRLMLARALSLPSNLIVLDEPTNDLDVETLDLLQELLGDYKGTILIVSHDRDFLDRVATSVIVSEGGGRWRRIRRRLLRHGRPARLRAVGPGGGAAAKPEKAEAKPKGEPQAKRKLSFNEKRALELLPQRMDALRAEIDALEAKLGDADFAARDPAAFQTATNRYGELRAELEKAEDEWLALEILREGIEGQEAARPLTPRCSASATARRARPRRARRPSSPRRRQRRGVAVERGAERAAERAEQHLAREQDRPRPCRRSRAADAPPRASRWGR